MTEIELIYAEDLSKKICAIEPLLSAERWSCETCIMRRSIGDALRVYAIGRSEFCFIPDSVIEKISKIIWKELTEQKKAMILEFERL